MEEVVDTFRSLIKADQMTCRPRQKHPLVEDERHDKVLKKELGDFQAAVRRR